MYFIDWILDRLRNKSAEEEWQPEPLYIDLEYPVEPEAEEEDDESNTVIIIDM